jgi:hypothetical protein
VQGSSGAIADGVVIVSHVIEDEFLVERQHFVFEIGIVLSGCCKRNRNRENWRLIDNFHTALQLASSKDAVTFDSRWLEDQVRVTFLR